jgi:hypothetical protein
MTLEFSRQICEKYPNIKFDENTFGGSRVVPCELTRQTGMTKLVVTFRNPANSPKHWILSINTRLLKSLTNCFCPQTPIIRETSPRLYTKFRRFHIRLHLATYTALQDIYSVQTSIKITIVEFLLYLLSHFTGEYSGDLSNDNGHLTTQRCQSYNTTGTMNSTTGTMNSTQIRTSVLVCALHYTRDVVKDEHICSGIFMQDIPVVYWSNN